MSFPPWFLNLILLCALAFKCTTHITFGGPTDTYQVKGGPR